MFETIKRHSTNSDAVTQAQTMLNALGFATTVDGKFGSQTEAVVTSFQASNGLVADGIIGSKTWQKLVLLAGHIIKQDANRFLSEEDLVQAAQQLNIEVAAIKAVNEVESRGEGFLNGQPVILFERHVFWRRLEAFGIDPKPLQAGNEDILSTKTGGYRGGIAEHNRLARAQIIHPRAALESASWGLFQIMGYHWKNLKYADINEFVTKAKHNEAEHLEAFTRYLKWSRGDRFLRLKRGEDSLSLSNFEKFAKNYNGPMYWKNQYHTKMMKAYRRYKKQEENGLRPAESTLVH
ncbi:MAG: N-acetylmuramidase domain-containing protein [Thiolinea sp.]